MEIMYKKGSIECGVLRRSTLAKMLIPILVLMEVTALMLQAQSQRCFRFR